MCIARVLLHVSEILQYLEILLQLFTVLIIEFPPNTNSRKKNCNNCQYFATIFTASDPLLYFQASTRGDPDVVLNYLGGFEYM